MPYQVICPAGSSISLLKAVGEMRDDAGTFRFYEHESVIRYRGEIVADEDVSPVVVKLYDGDPASPSTVHTRSILRRITAAQARKLLAKPAGGLGDDAEVELPEEDPLAEQVQARPKGKFASPGE